MNGKNIRYGSKRAKTKEEKPLKLAKKILWQTLICTVAFLMFIPVSKTETGLKTYISKALVATSDMAQARVHFREMCVRLTAQYPALEENMMWGGFMELIEGEPTTEDPTAEPKQTRPQTAEEALDLVAQASPEEFTYPENVNMIMPLNGLVTSPFGLREHPVSGDDASHYGVDIAGNRGDAVVTTAPGKVIQVQVHDIYGNCVLIQHTERIKSFYAHLDEVYVAEGDIVGEASTIGAVGSTGVTTGPHLHFGVRVDDEPTDPEKYIKMEHR